MTDHDPDRWDTWHRDPDSNRRLPDVTHADDEPVGVILGPDGATLAVVYPARLPFGFAPSEDDGICDR